MHQVAELPGVRVNHGTVVVLVLSQVLGVNRVLIMGDGVELRVPLVTRGRLVVIVVRRDGMAIRSINLACAVTTVLVHKVKPEALVDFEVIKVLIIAVDCLVLRWVHLDFHCLLASLRVGDEELLVGHRVGRWAFRHDRGRRGRLRHRGRWGTRSRFLLWLRWLLRRLFLGFGLWLFDFLFLFLFFGLFGILFRLFR